jgi:hypothetical protein
MSILPSENPRIVKTSLERSQYPTCHSWLRFAPHTCDLWGIDFSLVRYYTILGFSDGRIVALLHAGAATRRYTPEKLLLSSLLLLARAINNFFMVYPQKYKNCSTLAPASEVSGGFYHFRKGMVCQF